MTSTTQDTAALHALDLLRASEDRTDDVLPLSVNLSFAPEQWKRTILVRTPTQELVLPNRGAR